MYVSGIKCFKRIESVKIMSYYTLLKEQVNLRFLFLAKSPEIK